MKYNTAQLQAINFHDGNCCVIACAGSGKTTCLVNRIKNLIETHNVNPSHILAVVFNNKAKKLIIERLSRAVPNSKSVHVETFHSLGYRIIRQHLGRNIDIMPEWEQLNIISYIAINTFHIQDDSSFNKYDVIDFISKQKNELIDPDGKLIFYEDQPFKDETMRVFYKKYEEIKKRKNKIDLDDLLYMACKILMTSGPIREMYQNYVQYLLADEFQDVNTAQYTMIKIISEKWQNTFVVGDFLQNIYEWRGANNNYIKNFYKDYEDVTVIHLDTNYRSSSDIVELANLLASKGDDVKHPLYVPSKPYKGAYKKPEYKTYRTFYHEADSIAEKLTSLVTGQNYKYSDIAIMTRTNAQLQVFEEALFARDIAYKNVGSPIFFDQPEIKILIDYLRLAVDPGNNEAFVSIYNRPLRYLGSKFMSVVEDCSQEKSVNYFTATKLIPLSAAYTRGTTILITIVDSLIDKVRTGMQPQAILKYLITILNYNTYLSTQFKKSDIAENKKENVSRLVDVAARFKTTQEFLAYIDKAREFANSAEDNPNAVQLITVHKSKGLEYPVVFIAGMNKDIFPHKLNKNLPEELRLFYVAITRAEKELYISSVSNEDTEVSSFINLITPL